MFDSSLDEQYQVTSTEDSGAICSLISPESAPEGKLLKYFRIPPGNEANVKNWMANIDLHLTTRIILKGDAEPTENVLAERSRVCNLSQHLLPAIQNSLPPRKPLHYLSSCHVPRVSLKILPFHAFSWLCGYYERDYTGSKLFLT